MTLNPLSSHLEPIVHIQALQLAEEDEQEGERKFGWAHSVHKVEDSGHDQHRNFFVPYGRPEGMFDAEEDARKCILDQIVSLLTALK